MHLRHTKQGIIMRKSLLSLAIAATLSITVGCGGGGGGGDDSSPVTPVTTTASTLAGTAAAGIIKDGVVTAYELGSNGEPLQVDGADKIVGTTRTVASGQYSLEFDDTYDGGIVKVIITADDNTNMVCDAFGSNSCGDGKGFGDDVKLPEGFALNAIVNPQGSNTVSVQITPLTHMAAARAIFGGEVSAESVANAISEVSSFAGVNIMDTAVPDITSAASLAGASENAKQLALFNAGLASVLFAGDVASNFNDKLEELSSSFEDGDFDSNDAIKITDITAAIGNAVTAAAANSTIQDELESAVATVAAVVEVIENDTTDGGYNPEPTDSANQSKIDQAKSLLTNARTFIEKISEDFDEPLDALNLDVEAAGAILSDDTAIMGALLGEAISQVLADIDVKTSLSQELDSPGVYTTTLVNGSNGEIISGAIIATFSTTNGISLTLNGSLTGSEFESETRTVDITNLKLATNLTESDLTVVDGVLEGFTADDIQLVLTGFIGNDDTSLELTNVVLNLTTTGVDVDLTDDLPSPPASSEVPVDTPLIADKASKDQRANEEAIIAASFDGEMIIQANNTTFEGDVEIKLVDIDDNVDTNNPLSVQKVSINGEFTSAKGAFSAGASLTIGNAAAFDTFGLLNFEPLYFGRLYYNYVPPLVDQVKVAAAYNVAISENGNELVGGRITFSTNDGYQIEAYFSNGDVVFKDIELSGAFEESVVNEIKKETEGIIESLFILQAYIDISGDVSVEANASFADLDSVDDFVKGTVMLSTTANVPELPEATVVSTFNRTDFAGGDVSITVAYDGQSFTLKTESANVDAEEPEATLTLSNPDNVKMLMNLKGIDGDVSVVDGTVTVSDTVVGTISETDSGIVLVRYTDGTFESLF